MRQTDIVIAGGGLAGSTAAAMLGRAGSRNGAGRSACDLSAGFPRREARQHADRGAAQDRSGRRGAARRDARRRKLDRALRPAAREAAGRPARHPVRRDGQHDARRDPAGRGHHPRQGHGCRDERGPPDRHALDRRTDFRTPCRGGERAQCRPAPQARHGAARHLQDALDHARLRSRAGGAELFVSGAHLLRRASVGPHRLHHAVSDRRDDAREPLRLSRAWTIRG